MSEEKVFTEKELSEMFDKSFLPMIQEFAKRAKEKNLPDTDVEMFQVQLLMQFNDLKKPLTYKSVQDRIQMQIQPFTKEDVEKAKNAQENTENK